MEMLIVSRKVKVLESLKANIYAEMLAKHKNIKISRESLRQLLISNGTNQERILINNRTIQFEGKTFIIERNSQ